MKNINVAKKARIYTRASLGEYKVPISLFRDFPELSLEHVFFALSSNK